MTVTEYEAKFSELSKYTPNLIATKRDKDKKFQDGLIQAIRNRIMPFLIEKYTDAFSRALAIKETLQWETTVEAVQETHKRKKIADF